MKLTLSALLLLCALSLTAHVRWNGVYVGQDVSGNPPRDAVVEFAEDGTVLVYLGHQVPGLKDRNGWPVFARRVRTIHE